MPTRKYTGAIVGICACLLSAALAWPLPVARAASRVTLLAPPVETGQAYSEATGLDSTGRVIGGGTVGFTQGTRPTYRGLVWDESGRRILAPPYGAPDATSSVAAVNGDGLIVGSGTVQSSGTTHALLWRDGVAQDLGTLRRNNEGFSLANGINQAGVIVGGADAELTGDLGGQVHQHATVWRDGVPQDLKTLLRDHDGSSMARGINDSGQIVGWSMASLRGEYNTRVGHATFWQDGVAIDLGTLQPDDAGFSEARAINNAGLIVGAAQTTDGSTHATTWLAGRKTDLGLPAGFAQSFATAVNNDGVVVGFAQASGMGQNRAYLWRGGAAVDLTSTLPADSDWVLLSATGINDRGQVSGVGLFRGLQRAYLLDPDSGIVPTPSASASASPSAVPSASPSPSASASPSPSPATPTFADVLTDYWAYSAISGFAARGITTGCGKDDAGRPIYCPERGVTRAEMATFLTRAFGQDKQAPPSAPTFADVPADYWAYQQIEAFVKLGITTGCGTNELGQRIYCPDRGVTRAEMAAFMVRAKGQQPLAPATPTFADVPADYWAFGQIERFLDLKATTGCGEDEQGRRVYCPGRGVTRAEMAVFIIRTYP